MLFRGITVLSGLTSLLATFLFGGFEGFRWLWMLPCWFAGAFLSLALLAMLVLYLICQAVDTDKQQEHDSKFYRCLLHIYIEALIPLMRVHIHPEGLEQIPADGRFLLVCNHLHVADPGVLLHCFPDSQLAFIAKKETAGMFIVGKLMRKILCQFIDRENDRAALKTILRCIQLIKEDEVSIAVFPEGYTSLDGKLHHFRSGAFKIAQKTDVPIVVCTLKNIQDVFRNFFRLRPTHVPMHLVKVIYPEEYKGMTTIQISDMVYELMIGDLGEEFRCTEG